VIKKSKILENLFLYKNPYQVVEMIDIITMSNLLEKKGERKIATH
jgi:hypothetical protein